MASLVSHKAFSTAPARSSNQSSTTKQSTKPSPSSNPELPRIKFSDLGASPAVKYTLYAVLGVLGTMETIFYAKVGWRWLYPPVEAEEGAVEKR